MENTSISFVYQCCRYIAHSCSSPSACFFSRGVFESRGEDTAPLNAASTPLHPLTFSAERESANYFEITTVKNGKDQSTFFLAKLTTSSGSALSFIKSSMHVAHNTSATLTRLLHDEHETCCFAIHSIRNSAFKRIWYQFGTSKKV